MVKIGIMSAMAEELDLLLANIKLEKKSTIGLRSYFEGELFGKEVVIVFSRWGKVAAATTAATLIERFNVNQIIFTGVAGATNSVLKVGDIVVANKLYQHDFDASPFLDRYVLPIILKKEINTDESISLNLFNSSKQIVLEDKIELFSDENNAFYAAIASGDQFIKDEETRNRISNDLPEVFAVEMEGGAVAQVCYEHSIPFAVVRIISDSANQNSPVDFASFVDNYARIYSYEIIKNYLSKQIK